MYIYIYILCFFLSQVYIIIWSKSVVFSRRLCCSLLGFHRPQGLYGDPAGGEYPERLGSVGCVGENMAWFNGLVWTHCARYIYIYITYIYLHPPRDVKFRSPDQKKDLEHWGLLSYLRVWICFFDGMHMFCNFIFSTTDNRVRPRPCVLEALFCPQVQDLDLYGCETSCET